jgi:hypothetical protein
MYRFCDNVWAFVSNDCEFREMIEFIKVGNVKMVACNDKNTCARAVGVAQAVRVPAKHM